MNISKDNVIWKQFCFYKLTIFTFLIISTTSCYTNNEEELYPKSPPCLESNISFAMHVSPLIASNCLGCHSNAKSVTFGGNLSLEGYTKLKEAAESNSILPSIKHLPNASPMPKGNAKLSECNIRLIEAWINEGAKDN